ncbi:hypothetical protein [Alkalicoccobacillus plakortidis]|nr:hypothetical protein [Alkalicoccobacillus plakortidis]
MAGMSNNDNFLIFTGAITAIILALAVDLILGLFSKQRQGSTQ